MKQKKKEPEFYMYLPYGIVLTRKQALRLAAEDKIPILKQDDKDE